MNGFMDLHVYTNNSPRGQDKVSYLCETAVAKGLRAVALTDLCGMDTLDEFDSRRRLRHAFYDTAKARQLFFGSLSVFSGIEFEQAYLRPAEASALAQKRAYDIVLSSVTAYEDSSSFGLSRETSPEEFAVFSARYTDLLKRTVTETDFDVLSRPLAPLRSVTLNFGLFEEQMKDVLRLLAEKDKALEVDTADLLGSERIRDLYMRLISAFRDLGGRYLTVGSESDCFDRIGAGVELACAAVKRTGFGSVCFYDQRIPYEVEL